MATAVHHTAGRRAVLPGFLLTAMVAVAVAAFVVPALGSGTASDTPAVHAAPPAYPREVRVSDLTDATLRETALHSNPPVTVLVEVGPGVYAQPRRGALGSVGDYTAVFGRCADVNRFARSHAVARACW